jgi:hypothetical protein
MKKILYKNIGRLQGLATMIKNEKVLDMLNLIANELIQLTEENDPVIKTPDKIELKNISEQEVIENIQTHKKRNGKELLDKIIEMEKAGIKKKKIAKNLGISDSYLYLLKKRYGNKVLKEKNKKCNGCKISKKYKNKTVLKIGEVYCQNAACPHKGQSFPISLMIKYDKFYFCSEECKKFSYAGIYDTDLDINKDEI